jgi:hypothetical protein
LKFSKRNHLFWDENHLASTYILLY